MSSQPGPRPTLPSLEALGREFSRLAADGPAGERAHSRLGIRMALALSLVAALTAASFTPPGRAVADRVGQIVGIVEDDGEIVIAVGKTPQDLHPYRVSAFGDKEPGETCVFLNFEELPGSGYGSCLAGEVPADLARDKISPFVYSAPHELFSRGSAVLQGLAAADVAEVQVTYRDADDDEVLVPVDISILDRDLLEEARLTDDPTRFFAAFLPPEALEGAYGDREAAHVPRVEIRALDSAGNQIRSRILANLREYEHDLRLSP